MQRGTRSSSNARASQRRQRRAASVEAPETKAVAECSQVDELIALTGCTAETARALLAKSLSDMDTGRGV